MREKVLLPLERFTDAEGEPTCKGCPYHRWIELEPRCPFTGLSQVHWGFHSIPGPSCPIWSASARPAELPDEALDALDGAPIASKYHGQHGFDRERFLSDYDLWRTSVRAVLAKAGRAHA